MRMFRTARRRLIAMLASVTALGAVACVDSFGGSNIQATLSSSVQPPGTPADFGRPPPRTHYSFHGVRYARDADGTVVDSFAFKVVDFEVRPVINRASPCFLEAGQITKNPGLHTTMIVEKMREELAEKYGALPPEFPFPDPTLYDEGDVIDFLTAEVRRDNLGLLESQIRAVTTHSPAEYPGVTDPTDCGCTFDPSASDADLAQLDIPNPACMSDECNAMRAAVCGAVWTLNPALYEGSDTIFKLPNGGALLGHTDGMDPRAGSFLGGVGIFVPANLAGLDGMLMNWQFNCAADTPPGELEDCAPVYPDGFPAGAESPLGYHYMAGTATDKTRGVLNIPMTNSSFLQIRGEAAIWTDLDSDDVQF